MGISILFLIVFPAIAAAISLHFKMSYLFGIICFYLAPGACIAIKDKKDLWKPLAFSVLTAIPFVLIVDYVGTVSNLWNVPYSALPLLLGMLPFEDYVWMMSAIFTAVMLSGVSGKASEKSLLNPRMNIFIACGSIAMLVFFGNRHLIAEVA